MATWATIEQVEDWLGAPQDQRMIDALAASQAWCEHIRPDLVTVATYDAGITYDGVDPFVDTVGPNITHAVVLYASLLWRERTTPSGFSTYGDDGTSEYTNQSAMVNIHRLLGARKPVAR